MQGHGYERTYEGTRIHMYEKQLQHNVLHVCVCMYGILFIV